MKVDYLEKQLLPMGFLMPDSLSGVAAQVKEVFTRTRVNEDEEDKISYWQSIFSQSKANGCYRGEDLPHMKWQWPRGALGFRNSWVITPKLLNLPLITRRTKGVRDERAAQVVLKEPFKK